MTNSKKKDSNALEKSLQKENRRLSKENEKLTKALNAVKKAKTFYRVVIEKATHSYNNVYSTVKIEKFYCTHQDALKYANYEIGIATNSTDFEMRNGDTSLNFANSDIMLNVHIIKVSPM